MAARLLPVQLVTSRELTASIGANRKVGPVMFSNSARCLLNGGGGLARSERFYDRFSFRAPSQVLPLCLSCLVSRSRMGFAKSAIWVISGRSLAVPGPDISSGLRPQMLEFFVPPKNQRRGKKSCRWKNNRRRKTKQNKTKTPKTLQSHQSMKLPMTVIITKRCENN